MELQQIDVPAGFLSKPFNFKCDGDFIQVDTVPSGNVLYIKTSEGETFKGRQNRSIQFEKRFSWIEITGADNAGETLELQIGLGWIMDSPDFTGGPTAPANKGQYAEGTDIGLPDNADVFPFLGGSRNRPSGEIVKSFDSISESPAGGTGAGTLYPLTVQRLRDDVLDAFALGPDTTATRRWLADKKKMIVNVLFGAGGTNQLNFSALMGTGSAVVGSIMVFNQATGAPTTNPGIIDKATDGDGTYEVRIEGYSGLIFVAPVTNQNTTTVDAALVG